MTYKEQYFKFEKNVKSFIESNNKTVKVYNRGLDDKIGHSSFYNNNDLLEELYFEFYYDFAYDADYPDRDWFVTVIFSSGARKDFATFEQAEIFIKNTFSGKDKNYM